jgi:RNA recognition motif-containing protein
VLESARSIAWGLWWNMGQQGPQPMLCARESRRKDWERAEDNITNVEEHQMGSKLYVGGLPYSTSEAELEGLFAPHGTVSSVRIITDKFTGQSRGFGFVEMSTGEEASAAITALNGTELGGRTLTVNEARPQEERPARGGGGGRGGGKRDRW